MQRAGGQPPATDGAASATLTLALALILTPTLTPTSTLTLTLTLTLDGAATATDADGAGAGGTRAVAPVLALADFNPEDPSELAVKAGERLTPTGALGLGVELRKEGHTR